ncbi:MAG: LytR C-terminal domain-containing protein [Gemmatimonadetes bacterium]|nr:LytR C-terminal domain-containing protein [Gemmatimonadota bacterium]
MDRQNPYVQELILWGLATVAIALLLKAAFWPQSAAPEPTPQQEVPKPETTPQLSPIRVEILNGGGESQVAARLRKKARALGLDVIHEGNAPSFNHLYTLVVDLDGDIEQARQVAEVLGIPHFIQQQKESQFRLASVSIVIGRDYRRIGLLDPAK